MNYFALRNRWIDLNQNVVGEKCIQNDDSEIAKSLKLGWNTTQAKYWIWLEFWGVSWGSYYGLHKANVE